MGHSQQTVVRTDSVRLKLSADMVARLDRIALAHGMPASTVAAYGLASWINQQEANAQLAHQAAMEIARSLNEHIGEIGPVLERALPGIVASVSHALPQSEGGGHAPGQ